MRKQSTGRPVSEKTGHSGPGRVTAGWALALILCLFLGGCGGTNPEAAPPSPAPEPEAGIPASATEVSFWLAANTTAVNVMREIVDAFNRSQENYHVTVEAFGSYAEIYREVQTAVATRSAPDVVVLERDASMELHNRGLTMDLTQILREDVNFDPDRFVPVFYHQGVKDGGQIFAMPLYGTTQVLYYNKAAFAAAQIRPSSIRSWEDLAAAAEKIQTLGLCAWGWEPMWGYENLMDAVFSNGGRIYSENGRTVTINAPEWVEVWETFRKWLHEDRIMRIHSGGYGWEYWAYTLQDAMEGRAGGYTGSSGDQADVDFRIVGMMEQPPWTPAGEARPEAKALLLNVLSTSPQERQNGAYALIRYLIDVPAQVRWTIGTGYIAVNQDVTRNEDYLAYLRDHEYARIPLEQSAHAAVYPYDPTGGAIQAALIRAADRVEIENLPAQEALDDAQRVAQKALDTALADAALRGMLPESVFPIDDTAIEDAGTEGDAPDGAEARRDGRVVS